MNFSKLTIGYGITGSFCTFSKSKKAVENLVALGTKVIPIFSYHVQEMDTRFGNAKEYIEEICTITIVKESIRFRKQNQLALKFVR